MINGCTQIWWLTNRIERRTNDRCYMPHPNNKIEKLWCEISVAPAPSAAPQGCVALWLALGFARARKAQSLPKFGPRSAPQIFE